MSEISQPQKDMLKFLSGKKSATLGKVITEVRSLRAWPASIMALEITQLQTDGLVTSAVSNLETHYMITGAGREVIE